MCTSRAPYINHSSNSHFLRQSNRLEAPRVVVGGIRESDVIRILEDDSERVVDSLAVESPLSIEIIHQGKTYSLGITMRTPGQDDDLSIGFLYSEGIIESVAEIEEIGIDNNNISVKLNETVVFDEDLHRRQTITTSACGICGKESLTNLHQLHTITLNESFSISSDQISKNLELLNSIQPLFEITGGTHAAVAFDNAGNIVASREDVGRHNALDKLVGHMLKDEALDPANCIAHVSGRSSFELVQKAIRAGFPVLASVGAASSLAVDLAREHNFGLVSFLKPESMVIHSAPNRIT